MQGTRFTMSIRVLCIKLHTYNYIRNSLEVYTLVTFKYSTHQSLGIYTGKTVTLVKQSRKIYCSGHKHNNNNNIINIPNY